MHDGRYDEIEKDDISDRLKSKIEIRYGLHSGHSDQGEKKSRVGEHTEYQHTRHEDMRVERLTVNTVGKCRCRIEIAEIQSVVAGHGLATIKVS